MSEESKRRQLDAFIAAQMNQYGKLTKSLDLSTKEGKERMQELQKRMREKIRDKRKSLGYDI